MSLGLTREEVDRHGLWGVSESYDICKQAVTTLDYLKKRPEGQPISEALEQICGLNTPEIRVVKLGLAKEPN